MAAAPATLANWRTAPFNRWAFHHVRELVPSAEIAHDRARLRAFDSKPMALEVGAFFEETDTDGLLILQRGRVVYERYGNGMAPHAPHILMSVSKSVTGLLAAELMARGAFKDDTLVTAVLAELGDTAYRGATVRQLLDMRAGVHFEEDYLLTSGPIVEYRKATGWNPPGPGEAPSDLHSFYRTLTRADGPHGGRFHYVSPNVDLLAWVIEAATQARYADLVAELLWRPMGAEFSGYVTVDRLGAPRAAGGVCAALRDLARLGQWVMESRGGFLDDIERNGDPRAWAEGDLAQYYPGLAMRYRSYWYMVEGPAPLFFGMGIHGQNLFIDRKNEIVIAKVSSQALPLDAARIARTLHFVSEMRECLA